ncbi:MAG TPA: fibronectin type III domain-containing protein, partial [Candidatus Limnocylindria bacterium]|nr:fibronectin type III domain-containing protein [Candidatus Limnocylindria bacterium]
MELEAISCDGGVVLEWSASTAPDFHHYTALRSPEREIEPDWPPIAPAVDWGDTYATDRFVTSAVDASIIPSETRWFYRVMAYDADGAVVAASPVRGAQLGEVDDLGELELEGIPNGRTRITWQPYEGFSRCFSSYRVLYGTGGAASTVLAVASGQDTTELETDALHAGTAYALRVRAVRATTLGSFVVAESE